MICERCGSYLPDDSILCDVCGAMPHRTGNTGETGVRAIRQGRRNATPIPLPDESRGNVPEYGDYDMSPLPVEQDRGVRRKPPKPAKPTLDTFASRPNTRRGVPVRGNVRTRQVVSHHGKAKVVSQHPINWMLIGVICVGLLIAAGAGYFVYMNTSDTGQRMTARKRVIAANEQMLELATSTDALRETERKDLLKDWNDAPAQAYWLVGQEYMDTGDMEDAIMAFRVANVIDPENYDGLLLLGSAYELNNMDDQAEALYKTLTGTVSPARSEAYTALINIYLDNNRDPEAAAEMQLAYTNTDKDSFRQQRKDFIPNAPQVDTAHTSGRYELEQHITVTSPQGYDIYYTLDDNAVLPKDGKLVQDNTVTIPEGTFNLRAVCVVEDLVSDEMKASYTVYYPTPAAPKSNLAPNTYTKIKTVSIRAGDHTDTPEQRRKKTKEQLAMEDNQTFYYTVDGSLPDPAVSPKFDGTPITLPTGRVTLRAIAVNGYGKQSSTMEVGYKFEVKPYPLEEYGGNDVFSGFAINESAIEDFKTKFGEPTTTTDTKYLMLDMQAQHLAYDWGYAVFLLDSNKWELVRIEMNRDLTPGPRGVGIGSSEKEITAVFKDFGMPLNQDGSRNLYYDGQNVGIVFNDADGTRIVQYTCVTLDNKQWVLQYCLQGGRCVKIDHFYKP